MGFPRQKYWCGLPFSSPGDLPDPGIQSIYPALAGGFFFFTRPILKKGQTGCVQRCESKSNPGKLSGGGSIWARRDGRNTFLKQRKKGKKPLQVKQTKVSKRGKLGSSRKINSLILLQNRTQNLGIRKQSPKNHLRPDGQGLWLPN